MHTTKRAINSLFKIFRDSDQSGGNRISLYLQRFALDIASHTVAQISGTPIQHANSFELRLSWIAQQIVEIGKEGTQRLNRGPEALDDDGNAGFLSRW